MTGLTDLEAQVLQMLLAGKDPVLRVLREQAAAATVLSRQLTGVGFYTELCVPPDFERVAHPRRFNLGDVNGTASNVENGLGFLCYVEDGALSMLEGYTYDEPWPKDLRNVALSYSTGSHREIAGLRRLFMEESNNNTPPQAS